LCVTPIALLDVREVQEIELEGDPEPPRRTILRGSLDDSLDAAEPLAAYVRDKIHASIDRVTLAAWLRP
jgi:hypothetical protein